MKQKAIFLLFISLLVCISFNFVCATESLDNSTEYLSDNSIDDITLNNHLDSSLDLTNDLNTNLEDTENLENSENSKVIYIGSNDKEGNGSADNPFTTFKAACDSVNGENSVTIYVSEGTYELGEGFPADASEGSLNCLIFNTNNLNIIGNGNVIIKNKYNYDEGYNAEAFSLTSSSANFTFKNLLFDATNRDWYYVDFNDGFDFFMPFFGEADLGVFDNCSFIGFGHKAGIVLSEMTYNSKFINCYFECGNTGLFEKDGLSQQGASYIVDKFTLFENCRINIKNPGSWSFTRFYVSPSINISMNNVWLGQNELPVYINLPTFDGSDLFIPINRYAIFNVTQNYLGNNQYEIIGKLTWNGTEDQDGMENFQPMTVTLTSNTGNINSTAILKNGEFRAIYTSTNSNHKITATLDNEEKELRFSNVNISVGAQGINYGDNQNVTITFTQPIAANITVTVSNESYRKNYTVEVINKDSIIYTIPDTLNAGTYTIEVNLADNGLYGSNSTTFTVSKNDLSFDPNIPSNSKVGDDVKITVELPTDATGNVIVSVNGNTNFTETASTNVEIIINGLVAGDNNITVIYSGDDKYVNKSVSGIIVAEKVPINVTNNTIVIDSPTNSNTPSVSINLTSDATGNLTVTVNGKNYTQELVNGSAAVTITDLASGTYDAVVIYSGDGKYDPVTKNVTLTVNAIKTSIIAPSVTTTYNVAKELIVTLKDANGNALNGKKVTVKVGSISKTLTTDANGQVSVDISSLVPKTYSATIKFAGDDKYAQSTATAKVVVNKAKSMITAKKATFKAKKKTKKYTITLKAGKKAISKVKVTLKVKGKTYKATTNAKGKATFKITKLTKKGKHNAVIKFKGNKYYKASSKKVKLTIKK